jgi:1-aminocyclopropane-1-carboxylate synthase
LSHRSRALLQGSVPEYIAENRARVAEAWHPTDNPDGYLGLCIAENKIVWDLLEADVRKSRDVPARAFGYDDLAGCLAFREQLARFLGSRLAGRELDPAEIIVLAGASSVLESVFYTLADPGECILIPTPSYAGFWMDLETRDALHIEPVHTRSGDGFRLTIESLERAVVSAPSPVRALLLTNPDNPRGSVLPPEHVASIVDWAVEKDLHVVVDELYAFSVFDPDSFQSVLRTRSRLGEKVHWVWAFSKDFAASGLRCGVLVSESEQLRAAVRGQSFWSSCSGDTQYLLGELISDERWVSRYLQVMPERLRDSHDAATRELDHRGISYVPAEAGFFLLLDFREHLPEQTHEAADALWRRFLEQCNVNLTPGSACRILEPGFMRLCHAALPKEATVAAIDRIAFAL